MRSLRSLHHTQPRLSATRKAVWQAGPTQRINPSSAAGTAFRSHDLRYQRTVKLGNARLPQHHQTLAGPARTLHEKPQLHTHEQRRVLLQFLDTLGEQLHAARVSV